eukprot:5260896-Amphidinium_carterae.1
MEHGNLRGEQCLPRTCENEGIQIDEEGETVPAPCMSLYDSKRLFGNGILGDLAIDFNTRFQFSNTITVTNDPSYLMKGIVVASKTLPTRCDLSGSMLLLATPGVGSDKQRPCCDVRIQTFQMVDAQESTLKSGVAFVLTVQKVARGSEL